MKLSERLEALLASDGWNSQLSFSIEADELVREAAELARRVEEAPVRKVIEQHTQGREWEALAFPLDGFLPPLMGKRVAIVTLEDAS